MRWNFKDAWNLLFIKNPTKQTPEGKQVFKSDAPMPKSIYDKPGTSHKEHANRFHALHFIFKYKFFQPLVILTEVFLDKYLIDDIPEEWYNDNILVFNEAFDETLEEWYDKYILNVHPSQRKTELAKHTIKEWLNISISAKTLKQMKKLLLTQLWAISKKKSVWAICLFFITVHKAKRILVTQTMYDNCYKEFFNMLMFNITKRMNIKYQDHKVINHLLYIDNNPFNVQYFFLGKILRQQKVTEPATQEQVLVRINNGAGKNGS